MSDKENSLPSGLGMWVLEDISLDEFNEARERIEARQENVTAESMAKELRVPASRIKFYGYDEGKT